MIAYGAYLGSFLSFEDVSAVAAYPNFFFVFSEHLVCFNVFEKRTVSFLVLFFDCR